MATNSSEITSKARIFPTSSQVTAINNSYNRNLANKIEVKWDGLSWTDESTYLLSAKGDYQMEGELGEGMASQADFELENTTGRFLPENGSSPIQSYLRPRKQIRYSVIIDSVEYLLFTGYIKAIEPRRDRGTVNIHCFDNAEIVLNEDCPRGAYTDYYAHELIKLLAENAGIDTDTEVDVENSQHLVRGAYFGDRHTWPVMGEIAVAERGRVFFDVDGTLRFWGRDHIQNQSSVLNITQDWHLLALNFNVEEQHIKNRITVRARPRAGSGIQPVWTNGAADVLNPYTATLVYVPANQTQNAFLEIEDPYGPLPCVNWIEPVAYTDYTANDASDGSGTDYTNSIVIKGFTEYADAVYLEVQNLSSVDVFLTKFQIRANPLKIWKWVQVRHDDDVSISTYGIQGVEFENDFIDDEQMANDIAETELTRWKDAKNQFNIEIIGVPYLKVGDVISVEITDSTYEDYMIESIDWSISSRGFIQKIGLVNKIDFPVTQTVEARANIFNTGTQTVSAKARIGTVFQHIEAKASVTEFATINATMSAKANITAVKIVLAKALIKATNETTISATANITT